MSSRNHSVLMPLEVNRSHRAGEDHGRRSNSRARRLRSQGGSSITRTHSSESNNQESGAMAPIEVDRSVPFLPMSPYPQMTSSPRVSSFDSALVSPSTTETLGTQNRRQGGFLITRTRKNSRQSKPKRKANVREKKSTSTESLQVDVSKSVRRIRDSKSNTVQKKLGGLNFFGRGGEVKRLKDAFRALLVRSKQLSTPPLVLIEGYSGCGKTSLALQLKPEVVRYRGFLCVGKHDCHNQEEPYTSFVAAFADLTAQLLDRGDDFVELLRSKILETLGEEAQMLLSIIPSFAKIIGPSNTVEPMHALTDSRVRQLHFLFRQLVSVVCSVAGPLVLVLDDVQWADTASLGLADALLTNNPQPLFMVIATVRDNEIDERHPTVQKLRVLEQNHVRIERILLGNLDDPTVGRIINDLLQFAGRELKPLVDVVYSKTRGNAFFTVQFVQSLVKERLLVYNVKSKGWSWDIARIASLSVTDNVVDLLKRRLCKLSPALQLVLQVAACLGSKFDEGTLASALGAVVGVEYRAELAGAVARFPALCDRAVREGILSRTGSAYCFVHDQIQVAALNLIPSGKRQSLQLAIGMHLLHGVSTVQREDCLYVAVTLCNGAMDILKEGGRVKLARANLRAAVKAMKGAAPDAAKCYLESGLTCLGVEGYTKYPDEWRQLTMGMVDACYCSGDLEEMQIYVDQVTTSSCGLRDKARVYSKSIVGYAAQQRYTDAVDTGLFALRELGLGNMQASPSALTLLVQIFSTKMMCRKYDHDSILCLPEMSDEKRTLAMDILTVMASATYQVYPTLFLLTSLKVIRWSLDYGICKHSPNAFATFGVVLCSLGHAKEADKYGEIALALLERTQSREAMSRTLFSVYGFLFHWTRPFEASVKPGLKGYLVGIQTGDIELAFHNLLNSYWVSFYGALQPLDSLLRDVEKHIARLRVYKQDSCEAYFKILHQTLLNLLGRSHNTVDLSGSAMDQDTEYRISRVDKNRTLELSLDLNRLRLCCLFGNWDLAAELAKETQHVGTKELPGFMWGPRNLFYRGLTAVALARRSAKLASLARASTIARKLKKWTQESKQNALHKLLDAEIRSLKKSKELDGDTVSLYSEAIQMAHEVGFLLDEGLAHDLAGRYHLSADTEGWASYHFASSIECYRKWGAMALVEKLTTEHRTLLEAAQVSSGCRYSPSVLPTTTLPPHCHGFRISQ